MNRIKMQCITCGKPRGYTWFNDVEMEKWTQCGDIEGRRWGHMTTNLAESVNGQLKELRCLPIFALVRGTYYKMNEIFCDRRAKVDAMFER